MLDKLADVSNNKNLKVATAGFDTLAKIFKASATTDLSSQYGNLSNLSSNSSFNSTATTTRNNNITIFYNKTCADYGHMFGLLPTIPTIFSVQSSGSNFNELVLSLIRLDNAIASDP